MTSVFSWQNSISLCPTSFCTPRPNLKQSLLIKEQTSQVNDFRAFQGIGRCKDFGLLKLHLRNAY